MYWDISACLKAGPCITVLLGVTQGFSSSFLFVLRPAVPKKQYNRANIMAKSMHKHSDRQKPWREYTDYSYVLLREVQVQPYFITRGITEITQTAETSYCL